MSEESESSPKEISFDQKNQNVERDQFIIAGDAYIGHVGNVINKITAAEKPEFFVGVPGFPRYGLIGRDALLNDLITRLISGDHVTLSLSGTGGAGKTALAITAAHQRQLLAQFTDGVLWASVGPGGDPVLELGRWAEALQINPQNFPDPNALKRAVKTAIGQHRLLLVLDDLWDLDHAELLRCGGPHCAHLLTSRHNNIAQRFSGERENGINVPDLETEPAFALLKRIAPEACAVDEAAARELVQQVGGLPLAVELLGGYLTAGGAPDPVLFPELSQERLHDLDDSFLRLRLAQKRIGDTAAEEETLAEIMALSMLGFSENELLNTYALGAFAPNPATFSRAAAEVVSGAELAFLNKLVNRNLLEIDSGELALHQILADLARARMEGEAQSRHASYYLDLVNENRSDWRRIDQAYEQIRWAWEKLNDDASLAWVRALAQHQRLRGLMPEFIAWHKRGLASARDKNAREDEAILLNNMGMVYDATGQPEEALRLYEEALPIRREVGDRAGEAATLNNMGVVYQATGQPEEALRLYAEALPISREVGDRAGEATTLWNVTLLLEQLGRVPEAIDRAKEAIALFGAGLRQDSSGDTVEGYEELLKRLQS